MFEAFAIGGYIIWMRLVFLLIGIWLAAEFFFRLSLSANLSLSHIKEKGLLYGLAFFIAGRLFAVLANYKVYWLDPLRFFIVWDGEFSLVGGAIGIAMLLFYLTRDHRTTFLQWLDVLLPATTFGLTFDWLGKFAAAQSYGKPTNTIFGMVFDALNVRYAVPIHPVQLYYALFYLALTFLLLLVRKHSKRAGSETLFGIIVGACGIFLLESLRGDFGIPVFSSITDFIFLGLLFASLGVLAVMEDKLTNHQTTVYAVTVAVTTLLYIMLRPWIAFGDLQLRFSQVLAVLALLATVVYVVVHRRKYPHL